jgi:cellulose 1,4-beta-cellobiosidase
MVISGAQGTAAGDSQTLTVTNDTPSPAVTPTSTATPPRVSLKAQYKDNDSSATDKQIKPGLRLVNTGTNTVALGDIKLRYWYTSDGAQSQTYSRDYAAGCANVLGTIGTLTYPAGPVPSKPAAIRRFAGTMAAG